MCSKWVCSNWDGILIIINKGAEYAQYVHRSQKTYDCGITPPHEMKVQNKLDFNVNVFQFSLSGVRPGVGPNIKSQSYQYKNSHYIKIFIMEIPYVERPSLYWDGTRGIMGELGQYNGCWCLGSFRRRSIKGHNIYQIVTRGPCRACGRVLTACVVSAGR